MTIAMHFRKLLMEAAILLFLMTVSPVYAIAEVESRKVNRRPAQVQMINSRFRRRALDRRINPYVPVTHYRDYYGSWQAYVLAE